MTWENDPIVQPAAGAQAPWEKDPIAGPPVREVIRQVVKVQPDTAAEVARLAKRYPAPYEVVERNVDEFQMFDAAEGIAAQLKNSPLLENAIRRDPNLGKLAHDDIEPLAKIESGFAKTAAAGAAQAVLGISEGIWRTPDAAQRAVGYLAGTIEKTGLPAYLNPVRGVQDAIRIISEGRLPVGPKFMTGTTDVADRISSAQELLTDKETFGSSFADLQTLAQNADKALATAIQTGNMSQVGQVITDPNYWSAFVGQAIPSLYMAMKSGGSTAFLGWIEGMEQANNAADFEKRTGVKISDAEFVQAFAQTAVVNSLLERTGLDKVLGAKGNGLKGIAKAMVAEGGTEALQQINSNLSALLAYNPEQGLSEGVLASLMGGVASGGGVATAQSAVQRVQQRADQQRQQADAAVQDGQRLKDALQTAGSSALRERSPEAFRALMQTMTDGKLYVDGEVLNQLPAEVLNQLPEAVRNQVAAAAETGGTVEIPVADALTVAPGTPLEQTLTDYARTDPFALAPAEAKQAAEKAQAFLQEEATRAMAQAQDQETARQSHEAVRANIAQQIAATGRYSPGASEQMASWAAAFFTTYGSRLGITAEEMYQRYPLRILGAPSARGGEVMGQGVQYPLAPPGERYEETDIQPTMMSPDEFLSRVRPLEIDDASRDNIDDLKAHIQAGRKLDPLHIRADGKEDGRHRAIAARELGIQQVPVIDEQRPREGLAQGGQEQRDLIVTHNLTADNLLHAAKMGGLAVPSLAVTKRDTPLTGFGEITLIGPPELADPKGYAGTKVFGADIYSPRYPNIERELNRKAVDALSKRVKPMADRLGMPDTFDSQDLEREGQRTLERSLPLMATFLKAQGIEPEIVMRKGMDDGRRARLEQFGMAPFFGKTSVFDMRDDPAFIAAALAEARDAYAAVGKREALVKALDTDPRFQDSVVREAANEIAADAKLRARPEADAYATGKAMEEQVSNANLTETYRRFIQRELDAVTKSERIFQGFTNAGNRKYTPHTLENVVSILKEELRGGESFNYGVGNLRAKFTPEFKTLAAIRKEKGRLVSAEQFETVKKEIDAEFIAVGNAINPDASSVTISAILEDAAKMGVQRAAKSYGYEISDAAALQAAEFLTRLRTLPTAYFEAKVLRDVSLSEFKAAVVPADAPPDVLAALKKAGVTDIRTYTKSDEADRAAKVGEAVDAGGLLFQQAATPRGTFSPRSLELVLNPNANLSTWFHETGHFFLEVMADIASQPNAPAQIVEDMGTFLKWAGIKDDRSLLGAPVGALPAQPVPDGLVVGANALRNLLDAQTAGAQSADVISAEPFVGVFGEVARAVNDPQVLDAVVAALPVDVVNVLASQQLAPEVLLKDSAMLQDAFTVAGDGDVSIRFDVARQLLALVDVVAAQAAEATGVANVAGVAVEGNAAAGAIERSHGGQGYTALQKWNRMTLDEKRPFHERWAESAEVYVMEGKAPSVELQPLMRRFATWLKSVYGSIQKFLASWGQATNGPVLGQADDSAFKRWFGDSKVRDAEGKPLVVYHGSPKGGFDEFDVSNVGVFFSNRYDIAASYAGTYDDVQLPEPGAEFYDENKGVYSVFLKLQNPMVLDWGGKDWGEGPEGLRLDDWANRAKRAGHDGLVVENVVDTGWLNPGAVSDKGLGVIYVVFKPEQIKSATGNDGSFDANDPSILSQDPAAQPSASGMQLNDDIRRVMDRMLATDEQIAQANEVAGLAPDADADAEANERLRKRSIADLKWAVKARDQVVTKLRKQAAAIEKDIRQQVEVEVDQRPEMRAKKALDALAVTPEYAAILAEHKAARKAAEAATREEVKAALLAENPEAKGLVKGQLLMKNKRDIDNKVEAAMIKWDQTNPTPARPVNRTDADVATIADSFGFESVDAMLQAIDAFGSRKDAIDGMTEQRMLEEHGDLVDERAITQAANEAVHNEARARSLATELRTQAEMLNPRRDTGETGARGQRITVNALVEAAKQFGANVAGRTQLSDLKAKAWQHTAAERRAAKRWQEATAKGDTAAAVKAKQDQMLNHAAARALLDAQASLDKALDFFKRVAKGNDEDVVKRGRDADIVNAARAVLKAYGLETATTKRADEYIAVVQKNDPETYAAIEPAVTEAVRNAQPLGSITLDDLTVLAEHIGALWHLAKRSRQMEVNGDLMDIDEAADQVYAKLEEIGIPAEIPGERGALTRAELVARQWLQQAPALLRRVEQWAEAKDGKFGGPFLRFIFQPVKDAADRYRTERLVYREKFQALVDKVAPTFTAGTIEAPEIGYTFGRGHNGIGHAELLHAVLHTGNESNKRKLLLGRGWATENADGTLDTSKWDALISRLANTGVLQPAHFDFAQGVWDLMEETKPLAQKTHRDVFGRYFAEVTADSFVDPWGQTRRGGYVPAQADPMLVQDADARELLETENASMSFAFPATNKGFTKSRVEYNRPLKLDLRTLPQHLDKVLLFSHMEPAVRGVAKLLRRPKVAQPLGRVDPAAVNGMLKPWINRAARQAVETPISADAGLNRMASTVRGRVGMALMFANVSNTLQQITGAFTAAIKVKPSYMRRALAQYIANPKKFKDSVWEASPYMADRASNEVAVLSDTLEAILINPTTYQRAEQFTRRHAYFLQTFFDNQMSPIIWSGAYNQALTDGMDERMAIRFADGVIRQTQGSTLPEDISRIESGPAYARLFTQFIGYFNMMANTNATAVQQIAREIGLKKGAGKALGVLTLGLLVPIWLAEAIALGMKGGPEDDEDDGYLDDWLASVFGFGTIKGILAGVPFLGAAAQSAVNRFNDQPADDKFSLSPTVSVLESAVGAPASVYKAIVDDASAQKAVRDASALITVMTGLPAMTAARPLGYLAGVADERIEPTGPVDAARGLVTGTASPESKQR